MISTELKKLVDPKNECCCESHLAHKCKEWAKNYTLVSAYYFENGEEGAWCCLHKDLCSVEGEMFEADTEEEAIFKACDYILNELSNK